MTNVTADERVDAGDGLDPLLSCSFTTNDSLEATACPHDARPGAVRVLTNTEFPACPYHLRAGGFLNLEARHRYLTDLVAELNRQTAASVLRLDERGVGIMLTEPGS